MEICVNDKSKLVETWLTSGEKQSTQLSEQLTPIYREYKEKKYLVTVFQSGERNLCDTTADLLCYNRKRLAQREVEEECQQTEYSQMRMTMSM